MRYAFLLLSIPVFAQKPEHVLVVANQNSELSKNVAEYYIAKRRIPLANLCSIRTTTDETIDRELYEKEIEAAVLSCLQSKQLTEKILYIVTTTGVPLRVRGRVARDGDNASVDSELTLLYLRSKGRNLPLAGAWPNPFFGKRDIPFAHTHFPIYLVTRLTAYDFNGIKTLVDRSLLARNKGKFVIDLRNHGDRTGDDWLLNAAILLPRDRVVLDESKTVLSHAAEVIGYASWGSNDEARRQRKLNFKWLPGGIMTEFVSTNGRTFNRPPAEWNLGNWKEPAKWFARSPQTLTADYLDEGATGAAGHVDEPYLGYTPRPEYLLPAYYSGRNLAESYYLSIPGLSWQNVVVGDPLCTLGKP